MADELDGVAAATGFSGVVRADRGGQVLLERAYGFAAPRPRASRSRPRRRFGVASGTKGLTALAVDEPRRGRDARARHDGAVSCCGDDLPLIDDAVTVEQLLAHRSGIGDYLDEEALESRRTTCCPCPSTSWTTTEDYLRVLGGFPQVVPARRALRLQQRRLRRARAARRAGGGGPLPRARRTARLRARGHARHVVPARRRARRRRRARLPRRRRAADERAPPAVRGSGRRRVVSTAADVHAFWTALFAGRIVPPARVAEMVRRAATRGEHALRARLLARADAIAVVLVGSDAGRVVQQSPTTRRGDVTATVMANTTEGAWAMADAIDRPARRLGTVPPVSP